MKFLWIILMFSLINHSISAGMSYNITTTWDSKVIDHPDNPVQITLDQNDGTSFKISIKAPFYNDPPKPPAPSNEPFFGLWDYEVVEVFFLNDQNQYVEIEVGPYGQYIVLLLNGYRNTIRHSLFIDVTCSNTTTSWEGTAIVPIDYLPVNVTKMNAYAIHGSGSKRVYEALYPSIPFNLSIVPDFHKLDEFKPFDRSIILKTDPKGPSSFWMDSLNGVRSFNVEKSWNGTNLSANETVQLRISVKDNSSLILTIDAPFYNDTAPPALGNAAGPYQSLKNFEVVHFFLLNSKKEYLEIQVGPFGHYMVAFWPYWNGSSTISNYSINYNVSRQESRWSGRAIIPLSYLPPVVSRCNAASTHGNGTDRKYNSLYPANPTGNSSKPDYHALEYFRHIDMSVIDPYFNIVPNYSEPWNDVFKKYNTSKSGASLNFPSPIGLASILLLAGCLFSVQV